MGAFVPAREATIPLTDKIFSRVWANDNLFLGQSTFMVEMQEMANILHNYTSESFIIIDEIWRGTSTYDWMSIAWAVLKELHDREAPKTLFATHYHELIDEGKALKWVENYSVAVGENDDWIVFLRKVIPWGIKKSYWLEVAKLWGISGSVIGEANAMLKKLERMHSGNQMSIWFDAREPEIEIKYIKEESKIEEYLSKIDIDNLTPIESLNKIHEMKKHLKK